MAEHVIRLPDVGEGIAEAELVEWHVKVGDLVRADTTLAAVMTDKATVEIPSPVDGEIIWLGAEIGDKVAGRVRSGPPEGSRRTGRCERSAAATTLRGRRSGEASTCGKAHARPTARTAARALLCPRHPLRVRHSPLSRSQPGGQRHAPVRSGRSRRRRFACGRERRASTCVRYPARDRPAASRTKISTPSPPAIPA